MRSKPGPPMTFANMRANGVRAIAAPCEACNHQADVSVDAMPENVHVPSSRQTPPLQPMRRQADQHPTRLAHEPPPRHAGLSAA
jgi:hypothetical protein